MRKAWGSRATTDPLSRGTRNSLGSLTQILSGEDFVTAWCQYVYKFETFATILSRTEEIKVCGGYPFFSTGGNGIDDALLLKLCLGRTVALSSGCLFRKRTYESSMGFSCSYRDLVQGSRRFLTFLDSDSVLLQYARSHPDQYREVKRLIVKMIWQTNFHRWNTMYRERESPAEWARSAFAMPFIKDYYVRVISSLGYAFKAAALNRVKRLLPWVHRLYRSLKHNTR